MIKYRLTIITTDAQAFEGQVESLIATGVSGSFGVMGMHAPIAVVLKSGPLTVKQDGVETHYKVSSGVLEVNGQNNCLILADYATKVNSLEETKNTANNRN